jgi:DNA repair protein RadC
MSKNSTKVKHVKNCFFYNPTSSDHQSTKEDHKITEQMIEIGRLMQIPLKDFMITGKGWFSFF